MTLLKGQSVSVVGLGKSGYQSALFLQKNGAKVYLTESRKSPDLEIKKSELERVGVRVELGSHNYDELLKSQLVVISPGISPKTEIYQKIINAKIPLWSEIELAYRFCKAPVIAVTGTNGKTTVTTLIAKLLAEQGVNCISCGNIGNPFIGEVERLSSSDWVVLEVSSFQLENIDQFQPRISVLLNLTDNHFDWHGTFEHYANAKWKIFKNQTQADYAIVNEADRESLKRVHALRSQVIYFGSQHSDNPNHSACLSVIQALKLDVAQATSSLKSFKGIEHRMELVESKDGICYINDSKSTTIASLKWALERMEKPAVVILGGRHKGGDFKQISLVVEQKAKCMIVIGEASSEIEEAFHKITKITKATTLSDAVEKARQVAKPSETVLFSPACASFDMFQNYQDRGRQFKAIVANSQNHSNSPTFLAS